MSIITHILTRADKRPIPDNKKEVRFFGFVFNEMVRLPYFLHYHRNLGVSRFFFCDNNSTDGTLEYLLEQPDCHVFHTTNSYKEAKSGIGWTKALLDQYGTGHWCLNLDADELLVYPHCEEIGIEEFCAYLTIEGADAFSTFLLDMYPKGSIADAVCTAGKSFFEVAPYFDKDYRFEPRTYLKKKAKPFPPTEILGGPRTRCFYPELKDITYNQRLKIHLWRRIVHHSKKFKISLKDTTVVTPALYKVPLIRWDKSYAYTASTHELNPVKLSKITGVLAHFKFFSDFDQKVKAAVKSGQYAFGSSEYKRYAQRMDSIGNLMYEGSLAYQDSLQLLEIGLVQTSENYEHYIQTKNLAQAKTA